MPKKKGPSPWRNRVKELRHCRPQELADHPYQWRQHPQRQREAMQALLHEIGIAGVLLAYESPSTGKLTSLDGHLRKSLADTSWPTVILDLTDKEAALLLATYDPVSALAQPDDGQLTALLAQIETENAAMQAVLADLYGVDEDATTAGRTTTQPPEESISPELHERHDYLVVYCDNQFDWQVLTEKLNLQAVRSAPVGKSTAKKKGLARVIPAKHLLEKLTEG